jgi:hypothetical protein
MSLARFRGLGVIVAFVIAPLAVGSAQEIGVFTGGGVGGIRDVRRPLGGGLQTTFLFHDWIGVRADAGYYWTLEHRTTLACRPGAAEPVICTSVNLSSRSRFPQIDAMALVRGHIPGKGIRLELGAGPGYMNVTNEIRTDRDSIYSPELSSSATGLVLLAGLLGHPPWKAPLDFEGAYVYHMTGAFGACTNQPNDPLCNQHLNFHELRFTLFYRPAGAPPR